MNRNGQSQTHCVRCQKDKEAVANLERLDENNGICHDCVNVVLQFWWLRVVTGMEPE